MAGSRRLLVVGLAALGGLSGCLQSKPIPPEDKVCDTVTPGAFGAPVPTSCHPRNPVRGTESRATQPERRLPSATDAR